MPPPGAPSLLALLAAAVVSSAVISALITSIIQFVISRVKRKDEVEDRTLARSASREDRVFEAKRAALVRMAQATQNANLHLFARSTEPRADKVAEVIREITDAYADFSLYVDDKTRFIGFKVRNLSMYCVMLRKNEVLPHDQNPRLELQRGTFGRQSELLRELIAAELGTSVSNEQASVEAAQEQYNQYLAVKARAGELDSEVTFSGNTCEPVVLKELSAEDHQRVIDPPSSEKPERPKLDF